jgi:signal transduction histidine kinase
MNVLKEYLKDYKKLHDSLKSELAIHKNLNLTFFTSLCEKIDLAYIDEDAKDLLTSNIGGLNRIRIILDNLSSFSQDLNPKLIQMSLNKCVDDALKVTGNVFKSGHQVDNQLTDLCPLVLGDLGQLQQVFVNLFINAANAMKVDGKLIISQTEDNHRVTIHIKYNGSGMGEETIETLFTPFFTTGLTQVGIGLGFSVSRVVLEAHDAQISVDSQLGLGTTFNLSFPVSI